MTSRPRVTFIGLGAMGLPMATRLAHARECDLTVFDTAPAAIQRAHGIGRAAGSLAESVADADVVLTMLPADEHVLDVAGQVARHGRSGQIFVDFSTIHPVTIDRVAELLSPASISVVSASCMKSVSAARSGELTIFLGGDQELITQLQPLLVPMSTVADRVGELRSAKALKLVNNLVTAGLNLIIAEALVLGSLLGLSHAELGEALRAGNKGGWTLHNHVLKHVLTDDLGTGYFSVAYMAKDVRLAGRMAETFSEPRFLIGNILAALRGAAALGHADDYHPVIVRWLEHAAAAQRVGRVAAARPHDEVVDVLTDWVDAAEWLGAVHALRLAAAAGVVPADAVRLLNSASAATAALSAIEADPSWLDDRLPERGIDTKIARAVELAEVAAAPASTLETAGDYARTLLHPADTRRSR
jgi:3-hydroxyisobutyrate dehydrogenase